MTKESSQQLPRTWQIAFVIYLALVMNNFFTGIIQRLLPDTAFSYRPEDIGEVLNQTVGLAIVLAPLVGLAMVLRRRHLFLAQHIRQFWQQSPILTIEIIPFIWLLCAAVLRHALALALLLPLPGGAFVEMMIFILQCSVVVVFVLCLLTGLALVLRARKNERIPS